MLSMNSRGESDDTYTLHYRMSHRRTCDLGFCPPGRILSPLPRFNCISSAKVDIIHGFATHASRLGRALRVVTLFDVFSVLDESREWQRRRSRRRKMAQYRRLAQTCDVILAISEATKRDFLRNFNYPEDRMHVVYGGVDPAFSADARSQLPELRQLYDLPESYFLYVGAPIPRKNVPRLINAYAASAASGEVVLIIAGGINEEAKQLMVEARNRGLGEKVRFIGYVPDEHLPALYACSEAFLFPTFYEGFGMPVLEAMACGVPVLIGNRGAAPEIARGHAVEVDPYDTTAITLAIDRLLDRDSAKLQRARKHAVSFTWDRCAKQTRQSYDWLINGSSSSQRVFTR